LKIKEWHLREKAKVTVKDQFQDYMNNKF